MALNVTGVPLEFTATVNTEQLEIELNQKLDKIQDNLQKKASAELKAEKNTQDQLSAIITGTAQHTADQVKAIYQKNQMEILKALQQAGSGVTDTLSLKEILGEDVGQFVEEARKAFDQLDEGTKSYIEQLMEMETELAKVTYSQRALDAARGKGAISEEQYREASAAMLIQTKKITDGVEDITNKFREYEVSLGKGTDKTITAQQELRKLKDLMTRNPTSPLFGQWQQQAAALQNEIDKTNKTIKTLANDTAGVDALVAGFRGLAGMVTVGAGAFGLLTDNEKEAEKVTKQVVSALALLNGVQEVSNFLSKTGAVNTFLLAQAQRGQVASATAAATATGAQAVATEAATVAQRGLTAAMMANPAAAILVAVTALVTAYIAFSKSSEKLRISTEGLNTELNKEKRSLDELFGAAMKAKEGTKERAEAIQNINKQYKDYLPNLVKETASQNELIVAYEKLNRKIEENIVLKFRSASADKINEKFGTKLQDAFDDIINAVKDDQGPEKAAQAANKINLLADEINKAQEIIDKFGRGSKQGIEAFKKQNAEVQKFTKEFGLTFSRNFGPSSKLFDYAKTKQELTKALSEQDRFFEEWQKNLKGNIDKTGKTLADYLAEKNFIGIVDKALTVAFDKAALIKIRDRLVQDNEALNPRAADFQKQRARFDAELKKVNDIIASYDAKKGETQKSINAAESKYQAMLEKRLSVLQSIAELEGRARRSGLVSELSEIDRINQAYDDEIDRLKKVNRELEIYNKNNPKKKVQLIDQGEFDRVEAARKIEVNNARLKQEAEDYKTHLADQRAAFENFEDTKKQIGIEKASEMFREQTKGFESYMDFLRAEAGKIAPKVVFGLANIGEIEKLKTLSKEIAEVQKKNDEELTKQRIADFARLFNETATFNQKKKALDIQYQKDLAFLEKEFKGKQLEDQKKNLKTKYDEELEALKSFFIKQESVFKLAGADLFNFSESELREASKKIAKVLKDGFIEVEENGIIKRIALTPAQKKELEDAQNRLGALINVFKNLNFTSEEGLKNILFLVNLTRFAFDKVADSVREVNSELADTMETLGTILSIVSDGLSAAISILSGDIAGAVSAVVSYYAGIYNALFVNPKKSAQEAAAAIEAFNNQVALGEIRINELYRERSREQVRINKLKLQGLKNEKELLEQQKQTIQAQYNDIYNQLQQQSAIVQKTSETSGGIFGIGATTKVVEVAESLAGKTFAQLEELFLKGQLTGKAKELFELLQKLKEEGADIDRLLEENKKQAQEILTGTTSSAILDSIVTGFKNGLRSAADFSKSFEDMMRNAILNALKFQYLEGPMQEFFEEFAEATASDSSLTQSEIDQLQTMYNTILTNADQQFQQLQQIAGISFAGGSSGSAAGLQGAIKGITENTAQLLAGQFGGLRLTAIDHLNVSKQALSVHQAIQANTALTALRMQYLLDYWQAVTTGSKEVHIN